ncbi:MAG: cytochrome c biogenesis protein CcdA [Chitinophagaceae bacterium]
MLRYLKPITAFFPILFSVLISVAQDSSAIKGWAVESKKLADGKYELLFTAPVTDGWQLYAPNQVLLDVKTTELKFSDSSITQEGEFILASEPGKINSAIFETSVSIFESSASWKAIIAINGTVPAKLQGTLFYTYGKNDEFYPSNPYSFTVTMEGGVEAASIKINSIDIHKPVNNCGDDGTKNKSLLTIFFLGLLGGLIALLTPCVFPMIPVTVTFFTKKSTDKKKGITNAILYGLFIFLIYILITLPFHVAGKAISPEIFNNISTNVWLNLIFFAIFVFFALSFFGLFEIGLPAGLANKMDSKSGLGNLGGIFFMAATLAIVSFSCTGPILGTLLVGVADQGAWPLTCRCSRFWYSSWLTFRFVCHVSALVTIVAEIWWMDDRCESGFGFPGAGISREIPFKCRFSETMGPAKKRDIYRVMDIIRTAYCFISARNFKGEAQQSCKEIFRYKNFLHPAFFGHNYLPDTRSF